MRKTMLVLTAVAAFGLATARAAESPGPEALLAGTRWMEIGVFDTLDNISPEKMLLLRLCTIADIAFVIEEGKLTRYDRAGLSGKSVPLMFASVDVDRATDGSIALTLHSTADGNDMPERYRVEPGGEVLRSLIGGANGPAYLKCRMGTGTR